MFITCRRCHAFSAIVKIRLTLRFRRERHERKAAGRAPAIAQSRRARAASFALLTSRCRDDVMLLLVAVDGG